jgi:hypothetical protein
LLRAVKFSKIRAGDLPATDVDAQRHTGQAASGIRLYTMRIVLRIDDASAHDWRQSRPARLELRALASQMNNRAETS